MTFEKADSPPATSLISESSFLVSTPTIPSNTTIESTLLVFFSTAKDLPTATSKSAKSPAYPGGIPIAITSASSPSNNMSYRSILGFGAVKKSYETNKNCGFLSLYKRTIWSTSGFLSKNVAFEVSGNVIYMLISEFSSYFGSGDVCANVSKEKDKKI